MRKLADNHANQAQKFHSAEGDISEEELGEDSVLLESPLDKIDPYSIFRDTLLSKPDHTHRHSMRAELTSQ